MAGMMPSALAALRVQAVETVSPKSEKEKVGPDVCRYFLRAGGCKRGEKCKYAHSLQGLGREARAKKCLKLNRIGQRTAILGALVQAAPQTPGRI